MIQLINGHKFLHLIPPEPAMDLSSSHVSEVQTRTQKTLAKEKKALSNLRDVQERHRAKIALERATVKRKRLFHKNEKEKSKAKTGGAAAAGKKK